MSNRRGSTRYNLWFPLELEAETSTTAIAISRDMSEKGILIATPSKVEVGAEVRLTFKLPGPVQIEHELQGVIVRVDNASSADRQWRYEVAIQFDDASPGLATALEVLSEAEGPDELRPPDFAGDTDADPDPDAQNASASPPEEPGT